MTYGTINMQNFPTPSLAEQDRARNLLLHTTHQVFRQKMRILCEVIFHLEEQFRPSL